MRIADLIVGEGANDAQQRAVTQGVIDAIMEYFRSPGRTLGNLRPFARKDNVLKVALPCKKIPSKDPEVRRALDALVLVFTAREETEPKQKFELAGGYNPRKGEVPAWMEISSYFPRHPGEAEVTPQEWQYHVAFNGYSMLKKAHSTLFHELIHHADALRWKDPEGMHPTYTTGQGRSSDDAEAQAYFRDPAEMNAYAQESLSAVEKTLRNAKSREEAILKMGGSAAELYKKVYQHKLAQFGKQVPEDVLRRLKKRTAQLWSDTLNRFST